MGFGIGTNTEKTDAGILYGKQEIVACDCWFTSSGRTIPRFLKYQDADGYIHSIHDIKIHSRSKKNYCGIPMIEYECSCGEQGKEYQFQLWKNMQRYIRSIKSSKSSGSAKPFDFGFVTFP